MKSNHLVIFVPHQYPHIYDIGKMLKHTGLWVNEEVNPWTWEKVVSWKTGIDLEKDHDLLEAEWREFIKKYYPKLVPQFIQYDPVTILGININLDKVSVKAISNRCLFQAMGIFWALGESVEDRKAARETIKLFQMICVQLGQFQSADSIGSLLQQIPNPEEDQATLREIAKGVIKEFPEILNPNKENGGKNKDTKEPD